MSGDSFNEVTGIFQDLNNVKKEALRGGKGSQPKGPSKKYRKKPNKAKNTKGNLKTTFEQERKFQARKLALSGRSLKEIKSLMKTGATHLDEEYTSSKDLNTLSTLEYGLERFLLTRGQTEKLMRLKFSPRRRNLPNREEVLAEFAIGGQIPINWRRDGNLVRKQKEPTPSRPGSSKGKFGKTRVIGADKVLRDFKSMVRSLQKLVSPKRTQALKGLRNAASGIKKSASIRIDP